MAVTIPVFLKSRVTQVNTNFPLGELSGTGDLKVFTGDVSVINLNPTDDARVLVFATTANAPAEEDTIISAVLNANGGDVRLSCKLFPPNTKFFINASVTGVVVGIDALGDA